jgi:hypothetical protein
MKAAEEKLIPEERKYLSWYEAWRKPGRRKRKLIKAKAFSEEIESTWRRGAAWREENISANVAK